MTALENKLKGLQEKLKSVTKADEKNALKSQIKEVQDLIATAKESAAAKDAELTDNDKKLLGHTAILMIERKTFDSESGKKVSKPFRQSFDKSMFREWLKRQFVKGGYEITEVINMPEECGKWLDKAKDVIERRAAAAAASKKAAAEARKKLLEDKELLDF